MLNIIVIIVVLFLINKYFNNHIEGYQMTRLPFDTEGIVYPMKLDSYYERERDSYYRSINELKSLNYVSPPPTVCSANMKKNTTYNRLKYYGTPYYQQQPQYKPDNSDNISGVGLELQFKQGSGIRY
jgi:hypothetical protein